MGHAWAHCGAVEALAGAEVTTRANSLRSVALELERLANHAGDLGAMAGDIGYLPTMSYLGRLRGDFLNLTAMICGNRFGRGLVRPGGVGFDLDGPATERMRERLAEAVADTRTAAGLMWRAPSVMSRFEGTGVVSKDTALSLGLVGGAARASELDRDARKDFPMPPGESFPSVVEESGDVRARADVRRREIDVSAGFIESRLRELPAGETRAVVGPLAADSLAVCVVEGWRGEICHAALTDGAGRFARYKVVDPSFHNWPGLAMALRDEAISDFPLCNKSFNLSYCGFDL